MIPDEPKNENLRNILQAYRDSSSILPVEEQIDHGYSYRIRVSIPALRQLGDAIILTGPGKDMVMQRKNWRN